MGDLNRILKGYKPHSDKWYYRVLRNSLLLLHIIKRYIAILSCKGSAFILSKVENIACSLRTERNEKDGSLK